MNTEKKTTTLVSKEELMEIVARYQKGEVNAEQQLKDANMRFIVSIAQQYVNKGLTNDELIAAGTKGLITAAMKFDPTKEIRFIAYAVWWIRNSILQALKISGNEEGIQLCNEFEERQAKFKELDNMLRSGKITDEVSADIDTLNLDQKKILLYSYGFGLRPYTTEEICERLSLTPYQVSQRRAFVIMKLRKKLLDRGNFG